MYKKAEKPTIYRENALSTKHIKIKINARTSFIINPNNLSKPRENILNSIRYKLSSSKKKGEKKEIIVNNLSKSREITLLYCEK